MSVAYQSPHVLPDIEPDRLVDGLAHGVRVVAGFLRQHPRVVAITGAGCSTESGIPDYRDAEGEWKARRPMQYQDFVGHASARQRYWARSFIGWKRIERATPNLAHQSLVRLEASGHVERVITQNVDGLHQRAGHRDVIDLHGRLDTVRCLDCGHVEDRSDHQDELEDANPGWAAAAVSHTPDGDADLGDIDYSAFRVPDCRRCGGVLKPDVVFFGESVPRERTENALASVEQADALLVVGSSMMVWSGYRLAREAHRFKRPVIAVNIGRTRADGLVDLRVRAPCGPLLHEVTRELDL